MNTNKKRKILNQLILTIFYNGYCTHNRPKKNISCKNFCYKRKGSISINNKKFTDYFPTATLQYKVQQPFILTNTKDNYDLKITVKGGGSNGQAEAVRLAISRALCKINNDFRSELKPEGLLTRDPRMVERKKFGQKKARKKFQFSKR